MRQENSVSAKDIIRGYIMENMRVSDLGDDFDIFDSGMVNSLFAIELMTFLEKTFSVKVTMDDLDMANFKSVNAAACFVQRKKGSKN